MKIKDLALHFELQERATEEAAAALRSHLSALRSLPEEPAAACLMTAAMAARSTIQLWRVRAPEDQLEVDYTNRLMQQLWLVSQALRYALDGLTTPALREAARRLREAVLFTAAAVAPSEHEKAPAPPQAVRRAPSVGADVIPFAHPRRR